MFFLFPRLPKAVPGHCQRWSGCRVAQWGGSTVAGIDGGVGCNTESQKSLRSCRIHNNVANVERKELHKASGKRRDKNPVFVRHIYTRCSWWRSTVPSRQSCSRSPCGCSQLQLCQTWSAALQPERERAHGRVFVPDPQGSTCQGGGKVLQLTHQGSEYQDDHSSCYLRYEDHHDYDEKLGEKNNNNKTHLQTAVLRKCWMFLSQTCFVSVNDVRTIVSVYGSLLWTVHNYQLTTLSGFLFLKVRFRFWARMPEVTKEVR